MSTYHVMEARGVSAVDVRGLETFINHTNAQQQLDSAKSYRRPLSSYSNQSKISAFSNNDEHCHIRSSSRNSGTPALLLRYLHPKEMKLAITNDRPNSGHFTNSGSYRTTRSAGPTTKRQMAVQCGIKSLPLDGKRWKAPETKKPTESLFGKGHVMLQAPDGCGHVQRGLSGSKVRPGASTPRPVSKSRQRFDTLESALGLRDSSSVLSITPRNSSSSTLHQSQSSLNGSVDGEENPPQGVVTYGWNTSEQGIRLQKQLTTVSSMRAMRRVSEMVQHRMDPTYKINGNKVTLQDRYSVDGVEMQKLQEMTVTREELLSDLRKMKFPYGARAPNHKLTAQKQRLIQNTESYIKLQQSKRQQQPVETSVYPSTPASEPSTARNNPAPKQLSQHSEEDVVDDYDENNFETNSANAPL